MKTFIFLTTALFFFSFSVFSQTTIYSYDFTSATLAAGWQNIDNTGNNPVNGIWKRSIQTGLNSTTGGTGAQYFLSDAQNNDNLPEDGDLITPSINCTGKTNVFLQFEQFFTTYYANNTNSQGQVLVSNDGSTWTLLYSVNQNTQNGAVQVIDISSIAANQSSVYIKFNYSGNWDGYWMIDDIKVFQPVELDVAVTALQNTRYGAPRSETVSGTIKNLGHTTIQTVDLSYSLDGGSQVNQSLTNLNLAPFNTYDFVFATPVNLNSVKTYIIDVSATNPNNGTDLVSSNNSLSTKNTVLSALPVKNVLFEEFTTAVCQFCPDAGSRIEDIVNATTNIIPTALHAGFGTDAMTIPDHETVANQYSPGAAPALMIDRVYYKDEEGTAVGLYNQPYDKWLPYGQARKSVAVPVSISATSTYNASNRNLTIDASAIFYSIIQDDYRINCYIVEDSVSGTGSGYNQQNAYNNDNTSPWYQKGNPIIGFKHRHVVRQMLGGAWGSPSVIPATTADGGMYTKQYTTTLPAGWNDSRIKLVVLVQHFSNNKWDREILNAMEFGLNESKSTGSNPISSIAENSLFSGTLNLYPNPTADVLNIELNATTQATFGIDIYNMVGQKIHSIDDSNLDAGGFAVRINTSSFDNGVYFISVKENGKTVSTQRFVVNH